jgi:fructose-bisphosphate aldolase class 1
VKPTPDNRRDYREMLFRSTEAMSKYISGVILYDETIRQNAKDGTPLVKLIEKAGSIPGIKVDKGTKPLPSCPGEVHLDAMNRIGPLPWRVSFSYGRALQAAPQKTWSGKPENVAAAQRAFGHRAMMNGLASLGQWKADLERKAAA